MTFTTGDLDGPGQSPKSLHQVKKIKELPASPPDPNKRKRKRGKPRRRRA